MRIVLGPTHKTGSYRIQNDVLSDLRNIFLLPQGVVVKAFLPDAAPCLVSHHRLHAADHLVKFGNASQTNEPVQVVRHDDKCQGFGALGFLFMTQRNDELPCQREVQEDRVSTVCGCSDQIDLAGR